MNQKIPDNFTGEKTIAQWNDGSPRIKKVYKNGIETQEETYRSIL